MTFLLEHVKDPVNLLKALRNIMGDDSSLFIAVPNALSVHRVVALNMGLIERVDELSENDKRVGHRRVYTTELLHDQVVSAGFKIDEEMKIGLKPVPLKQMETWSQEMVWALCGLGDLAQDHSAYLGMRASL
jgi:hypothetical protein